MFTTLLQPSDLMGHLDDPAWLVMDCRFQLDAPEAGERAWREAHIPGALYVHLDRDLAGPVTPQSGRHPLPSAQTFAETISRWGIRPETQVVAYDAAGGMCAARLWWMLRWAGHDRIAVLDGGLQAWLASGGKLDQSVRQRQDTTVEVRSTASLTIDASELAQLLTANRCRLVDARGAERFEGRVEPIDTVAGHVPTAVNHPFTLNLDAQGRFLPPAELLSRWREALDGHDPAETICMCGSGVSACHNLLAMQHAGLGGARLYPGSWSEWIRDPARPVASGPA